MKNEVGSKGVAVAQRLCGYGQWVIRDYVRCDYSSVSRLSKSYG
jgi:hypothetical protein